MSRGDIHSGLLKAVLDVIYMEGQSREHDTDHITGVLQSKGYWTFKAAETPERTVNSYFSQNPGVFEHTGPNRYRLLPRFHRQTKPVPPVEPRTATTAATLARPAPIGQTDMKSLVARLAAENAKLNEEVRTLKLRLQRIAALCDAT